MSSSLCSPRTAKWSPSSWARPPREASGQRPPPPSVHRRGRERLGDLRRGIADRQSARGTGGYHVTSVTDTEARRPPPRPPCSTASPQQQDDALRLQSDLSGLSVLGYDPGMIESGPQERGTSSSATTSTIDVGSTLSSKDGADVVLVTGSNFAVNAPPSTSSPGVTTSTLDHDVGFRLDHDDHHLGPAGRQLQPGGTVELNRPAPWDPRSCTASGGEGP